VTTVVARRHSVAVPVEEIARTILILRGQRVILDSDLAAIYGVSTGRLNEAVKRGWNSFTCVRCPNYTIVESPEHSIEAFATQRKSA